MEDHGFDIDLGEDLLFLIEKGECKIIVLCIGADVDCNDIDFEFFEGREDGEI